MGRIVERKASAAGQYAGEAWQRGQQVYVVKLIEANLNSKATAPMSGMAEQIEAIESVGWRLQQFAAAEGKTLTGERIALVCMFRRGPG